MLETLNFKYAAAISSREGSTKFHVEEIQTSNALQLLHLEEVQALFQLQARASQTEAWS